MLPGGAPEIVCLPEDEGGGQGLLRQTSLPRMPAEGCCSGMQDAGTICYACCDSLCNVSLHQRFAYQRSSSFRGCNTL